MTGLVSVHVELFLNKQLVGRKVGYGMTKDEAWDNVMSEARSQYGSAVVAHFVKHEGAE